MQTMPTYREHKKRVTSLLLLGQALYQLYYNGAKDDDLINYGKLAKNIGCIKNVVLN